MDASDITRQILAQATLKGYNTLLLKEGQPRANYDLSNNCCGFYDPSSCSWDVMTNIYIPAYPSYELRNLVNQGLVANTCIPTSTVSITKQSAVICPPLVYTVPLGNT